MCAGGYVEGLDLQAWDKVKDQVMMRALDARRCSDPEFCRVLLDSCDSMLRHYEASGASSYWGGSFAKGSWAGRNVLGLLLMDVRAVVKVHGDRPLTVPSASTSSSRHRLSDQATKWFEQRRRRCRRRA